MIISLLEARKFDPGVTQEDLDGIEEMIRGATHNHFFNLHARFNISNFTGAAVRIDSEVEGIRIGSTVEINDSRFNNGLYLVMGVRDSEIILDRHLMPEKISREKPTVTLVEYPADIRRGVTGLLEYDAKMRGKRGIAREQVARWTVTYKDVDSKDSATEGYPMSLMQFIDKYRRLRW